MCGEVHAAQKEACIYAALKTIFRVAIDAKTFGCAANGERVEIGTLNEDIRCAFIAARCGAADDTAKAENAAIIANRDIAKGGCISFIIKSVEFFVLAHTHRNAAFKLGDIIEMERTCAVIGDEICDIDERGNRA